MITTQPMSQDDMRDLLGTTARQLQDLHPVDVLTLAGFLAGSALQCWGEDARDDITRHFVANLLNQLGVTAARWAAH